MLAPASTVAATRASASATITIVNGDGTGEGLNDPTPVSPVGGNSGTTLGAQRLIAAQYAADTWAAVLDSTVEVRVHLNFDPLPCSATSAVLGSTGPTSAHANFVNAPRIDTWYPQALANKFAGMDLSPLDDIAGAFNSAVGTTCALPRDWYYGLDASPSGTDIDFVTVALHELAHGLGFTSFVDLQTGAKLFDHDDAFSLALEDHSACRLYPAMSDAQRIAASVDTGDLHWVGSNVVDASGSLTAGVQHPSGHVEMYAPDPAQPGSSVSHFSTALTPNELMEPSYTGPDHDVTLTRDLLLDVGWSGSAPLLLGPLCTGGEFQVNTTVIGAQHDPAVAFDGSGNFVIVWNSIQQFSPVCCYGLDSDVYGQRFASDGTPVGGEFLVNTHTDGDEGRLGLDVAMDAAGDSVVIWQGPNDGDVFHNAYPLGGIIGQRFSSAGTPAGPEFVVNTKTKGIQTNSRVAIADDGGFVVVWDTEPGFPNDNVPNHVQHEIDVDAQRFDGSGAKVGPEFQVNSYVPQTQRYGAIAMRPDGDFVAAWTSVTCEGTTENLCFASQDGEGKGVFAQRFSLQQPTCGRPPARPASQRDKARCRSPGRISSGSGAAVRHSISVTSGSPLPASRPTRSASTRMARRRTRWSPQLCRPELSVRGSHAGALPARRGTGTAISPGQSVE